jgi:hypothetical protein
MKSHCTIWALGIQVRVCVTPTCNVTVLPDDADLLLEELSKFFKKQLPNQVVHKGNLVHCVESLEAQWSRLLLERVVEKHINR